MKGVTRVRRLISTVVTDTDTFLDMPATAQNLYFHLSIHADDDGFVGNPKTYMRICAARDDDLKILIAKEFLIAFDNGVIVIKDWRIHNTIRKDRYHPTTYQEEFKHLSLAENDSYVYQTGIIKRAEVEEPKTVDSLTTAGEPSGNQSATITRPVVAKRLPEVKLSKAKLSKDKKTLRGKSDKRTYAPDSDELKLATKLWEKILENNPEAKYPNLQSWANDVRLMHERDKRTWQQISNMIDWCQNDDFWQANILSAKKLREKYDQLKAQALRSAKPRQSVYGRQQRKEPVPDWAKPDYKAPTGDISAEAKAAIAAAKARLAAGGTND